MILLLYYYLFLTKGATGIIQSPGYPDAYTANVDCLWLLETGDLDDRIFLDCHSIELGMYCLFSCYWNIILEFDENNKLRGKIFSILQRN